MGTSPTYPKCESDKRCAPHGEHCLNNNCAECRETSHCKREGMECQRGLCVYPVGYCDDVRWCPEGQSCVENVCQPSKNE